MTTETMREAVETALLAAAGGMEHGKPADISVLADAAIRTVLERLRERELVMREDGMVIHEVRGAPNDVWQAMLDAVVREVG